VDAQPLYLSQVTISGQKKNVLYVCYGTRFRLRLRRRLRRGATGFVLVEDVNPRQQRNAERAGGRMCPGLARNWHHTATPVIDRTRNAIYSWRCRRAPLETYFQALHALDLTTGKELFWRPADDHGNLIPERATTAPAETSS